METRAILQAIAPCGHAAQWQVFNGLVWAVGHGHGKHDGGIASVAWCIGRLREVAADLQAVGAPRAGRRVPSGLRRMFATAVPIDVGEVRAAINEPWFKMAEACGVHLWRAAESKVAIGLVLGLPQCVIAVCEGRRLCPRAEAA